MPPSISLLIRSDDDQLHAVVDIRERIFEAVVDPHRSGDPRLAPFLILAEVNDLRVAGGNQPARFFDRDAVAHR
jgi:hypothetical protein